MADHVKLIQTDEKPAEPGTPTQVANPSRASWRTFIQSVIGTLIAVNAALIVVQGFLQENAEVIGNYLPPNLYGPLVAGLNGVVIIGGLLAKLVALIMANAKVNEWIKAHASWLAAIPVEKG